VNLEDTIEEPLELKKDAEKKASEMAIINLERKGFKKIIPSLCSTF
jgi:hypothetical protein